MPQTAYTHVCRTHVCRAIAATALMAMSPAHAADPCVDIAADTVTEMRAGAGMSWTTESEGLARAAAGAACVKALSGRYARGSDAVASNAGEAQDPAAELDSEPKAESAPDEAAGEDGTFDLGGLKVRPMSGTPTHKPYQRARRDK